MDSIKIRMLLQSSIGNIHKFYWFERRGLDFYWGGSSKSISYTQPFESLSKVTFTLPSDLDEFPKVSSKFTYHESGQLHYKIENPIKPIYEVIGSWKGLNDITEPRGFYMVIAKPVDEYAKYTKLKLDKDGFIPIVFHVPVLKSNERLYFEFFLSPTIEISHCRPLINMSKPQFQIVNIGINETMFCIIRSTVVGIADNWPMNRELSILFLDRDGNPPKEEA